jgi:hypothetical protein
MNITNNQPQAVRERAIEPSKVLSQVPSLTHIYSLTDYHDCITIYLLPINNRITSMIGNTYSKSASLDDSL